MRRRPVQEVQVFGIQERRGPRIKKPWIVRWRVDGGGHSRSFLTQREADRFRSRLLVARQDGEQFDRRSGEPVSWHPAVDEMQVHVWARRWLREEWSDSAPRTRDSAIQALARFVPLVVDPNVPAAPVGLRKYLMVTLRPDAEVDEGHELERWLGRWVLSLGELDKDLLAEVDRLLGIGDKGQALAAETAGRFRKVSRRCIRRAVELERLPSDPWPPTPKGRGQRKARRKRKAIDVRLLPKPSTMSAIIAAIPTHQPRSRWYQRMTETVYYGGLRPSEVVMLRPRVLFLPEAGWGWIDVVEADDGYNEPVEPKTGDRRVPIPPVLVSRLGLWIAEQGIGPDDFLFRAKDGGSPRLQNWARSLKRACRAVGFRELSPYEARHAYATTLLAAGVKLRTAADWLGHSVETLVAFYVGALEGDDVEAMTLAQGAFAIPEISSHVPPTDGGGQRGSGGNGGETTATRRTAVSPA